MKLISFIRIYIILALVISQSGGGCRKAFLAQKPSTDLLVPNSLAVLQELLDNTQVMNISPALGEVSSDNYYLNYDTWLALDAKEHNAYVWASDLYDGQGLVSDWDIPYQQVFYANTVLQGLIGIQADSTNQAEWNVLKGWALFSRAFAFYNITQLFAKPYDTASAPTDPGIPIRLSPDINAKTTRASLQASYTQILSDLNAAESLLPAVIPVSNLNRPSKLAVQALLARIYLSVRDYADAWKYADSALQVYSVLVDYNSLASGAFLPFQANMPEVLYQSNFPPPGSDNNLLQGLICNCAIDTNLIASYDTNDLRRPIYYVQQDTSDTFNIKGSYSGLIYPFSGLATDELYLIRAECYARAGQTANAVADLNWLLMNRWRTGTFTNSTYNITSAAVALDTILVERRKELAFRGLRWTDLRRLNYEGWNDTLYRKLNGQIYMLLPSDSNLYTLPIPPDVIQFSGMQQNPR